MLAVSYTKRMLRILRGRGRTIMMEVMIVELEMTRVMRMMKMELRRLQVQMRCETRLQGWERLEHLGEEKIEMVLRCGFSCERADISGAFMEYRIW